MSAPGFAEFYDAWFPKVYNYARQRTGSATRADEIAADTFTRALKFWDTFDGAKGDRQTWLFSIAFRAVADHYRAEKRTIMAPLELEPQIPDDAGGPPEQLERAAAQRRLSEALQELEERDREIVSLRFFGGLTNRAIGHLLGLTESNVAVILFRSVRRMRQALPGVEAH